MKEAQSTKRSPARLAGPTAIDGNYHNYTMEWRTRLEELPAITDSQVVKDGDFWWVADKSISIDRYLGNPLKRVDKNRYAVYRGDKVIYWIDGRKVGESARAIPAMAAQLNLGVWLPKWAGPAAWKTAKVAFASVRVWQYDDTGDVKGVLKE